MKVGHKTDIGEKRENNEDNLFVDKDFGLFIVADGLGGHKGGEVASKIAVDEVSDFLKNNISNTSGKKEIYNSLMNTFVTANKKIIEQADEDPDQYYGMGTTIVVVLQRNNVLYIAHVGDSRAYITRDKQITQLTEDHSLVMQMVKLKIITSEQAKIHPQKNVVTRSLGVNEEILPDIQDIEWKKNDIILLCTDGLTDMVDDNEILKIITANSTQSQVICDNLVATANNNGGIDNISVVVMINDN